MINERAYPNSFRIAGSEISSLASKRSPVTSARRVRCVAGFPFLAGEAHNIKPMKKLIKPMKKLIQSVLLTAVVAVAALLPTGCTIDKPQGKILSVTERGIGFKVSQRPDTQTPEVQFGFFSSAIVMLPTQTNGTVGSPNFANTFDFNQSGALQLGIGENIAAGNYQTYSPGATNSAVTTQPK